MAKSDGQFSEEEKAAMKERAREYRAARSKAKQDPLGDLMSKIEEMSEPDRKIALRVHELVLSAVPDLQPKTWYGMPAYAKPGKHGKLICFFQAASKFKVRFSTFGFSEHANVDDGEFFPTAYALIELTPKVEKEIVRLVQKAAS
jgi:uncharacterized protein YdhG (YjbR/CyaY superfamily)